jgi:hypothetical protein
MGCSFEKNGYTNFQELTQDLVTVLLDNGFVLKTPTTLTDKFTLETTAGVGGVDPIAATQPWRIHFDCSDNVASDPALREGDPGTLRVFMGTSLQLPDSGEVAAAYYGTVSPTTITTMAGKFPRKSGELSCGFYEILAKTGTSNNDYEIAIPFASKNWGTNTIDEKMLKTTLGADPIDADITYLGTDLRANPLSFRATLSDHGLALVVWEEGEDLWGNRFSWFVVQRPVNPDTGVPLDNVAAGNPPLSRCPVFCVYSIGGGNPTNTQSVLYNETPLKASDVFRSKPTYNAVEPTSGALTTITDDFFDAPQIYQFVVRESDVFRPSVPVLATVDTPDHKAIINGKQQVSITEGNQYVISFINDINTDRYMYKEELDMITYASADVISMWSDIELKPYKRDVGGVPTDVPMFYKAMHANLPNNSGMRILILTKGNGVDGDCTTVIAP